MKSRNSNNRKERDRERKGKRRKEGERGQRKRTKGMVDISMRLFYTFVFEDWEEVGCVFQGHKETTLGTKLTSPWSLPPGLYWLSNVRK